MLKSVGRSLIMNKTYIASEYLFTQKGETLKSRLTVEKSGGHSDVRVTQPPARMEWEN